MSRPTASSPISNIASGASPPAAVRPRQHHRCCAWSAAPPARGALERAAGASVAPAGELPAQQGRCRRAAACCSDGATRSRCRCAVPARRPARCRCASKASSVSWRSVCRSPAAGCGRSSHSTRYSLGLSRRAGEDVRGDLPRWLIIASSWPTRTCCSGLSRVRCLTLARFSGISRRLSSSRSRMAAVSWPTA